MIKLNNSSKQFINELVINHYKEFKLITLLIIIESLLLSSSVLLLVPISDLFFNSVEEYSRITKYTIEAFKKINLPVTLISFFLLFVITTFLKSFFAIGINYYIQSFKFIIYGSLFKKLFSNIYNARWSFFNDLGEGKLFNTFKNELAKIAESAAFFGIFISSVFQLLIYSIIPIFLNYKLFFLIIFFSIFLIFPYRIINYYSKKLGDKNTLSSNKLVSSIQEMLSNSKYFISIGETEIPLNNSIKFLNIHSRSAIYFSVMKFAVDQVIRPIFITIIILSIVLTSKFDSSLSLSEFAAFFWTMMAIIPLISKILNSFLSVINYSPSFVQYKTILSKALRFREPKGLITFNKLKSDIVFKNVNFSYEKHKILNNLNLTIKKRKINFIFGKSGKGKSTIIDLITGIQSPTKGNILVNDINLKKIDKKTFRNKIGLVNQDLTLFYGTIRDNLTLFDSKLSKNEIYNSLILSGSSNFVYKSKKKIDTIVGERGTQLSGGQRQRLLLSRAFLKSPELIILDEPFNALDKTSRRKIMKTLRGMSKKITIVIISHDNIDIEKGDNIIRT